MVGAPPPDPNTPTLFRRVTGVGPTIGEVLSISDTMDQIFATEPPAKTKGEAGLRALNTTLGRGLSFLVPSPSRFGGAASNKVLGPIADRTLGTKGLVGIMGNIGTRAPGFTLPGELGAAAVGEQTPKEAFREIIFSPGTVTTDIVVGPFRGGITLAQEGFTPQAIEEAGTDIGESLV